MQWVFHGVLKSCQQYRSDNSISPKPATKRFLIFRIELLVLIDELSAHRIPPPLPRGRWGKGVLGISKILCEVVHTIRCCLCAGYVTATFFYAYAYVVQKLHSLLSSIRRIIQPRG